MTFASFTISLHVKSGRERGDRLLVSDVWAGFYEVTNNADFVLPFCFASFIDIFLTSTSTQGII